MSARSSISPNRHYSLKLQEFIAEAPFDREPIAAFVARAAQTMPPGSRIADVGAGTAPYRELFTHVEYITIDHEASLHKDLTTFDVLAAADAIPLPDATLDAILCTQVLEHVSEPGVVLAEFHRLLKRDGRLFVTVPFVGEEHELPYDFYRYTRAGIDHIFRRAGFTNLEITSRSDCFSTLAQLVRNARWSLPVQGYEGELALTTVAARLQSIADELATFSSLDARQLFPLGYQVVATPSRSEAADDVSGQEPSRSDPTAAIERTASAPQNRRTPILYLAPWVDLGGSDKGTIDWFKNIDLNRWAPSLITTQPSDNRWVPSLEEYAEEIWTLPTLMSGGDFPGFVLDFIESRSIELVHIMNSRLGFDLIPDIKFLRRAPAVVVQLHAEEPDRSGYVRYVATRYSNLIDAYSVISQDLAAAMQEYDVPRGQIHVIHNGIDALEEFNPDLVAPFGRPPGDSRLRILWPGRVVAQKDPLLTVEVVKALQDRGLDFSVDIVGDGDLKPQAITRAADLGVAERIRWHAPSIEMPRWYRNSDLLLMTSRFEGVPYVIYEACAMGLPVVAPALPGITEFAGEVLSEFLVDPRDSISAYADAVERLLVDPNLRSEVGSLARQHVLDNFTAEEMGARNDVLYDFLLDERQAARRAMARRASDDRAEIAAEKPDRTPRVDPVRLDRRSPPDRSVAVIVPCYQHGKFLDEAIETILEQSLPAKRIVVVDDASHDQETIEALARWEFDARVHVVRLAQNSGPSVARNRALAEITESYVLPLDADDALLPNALADMVEQLEQAPESVGFIYPNAQHFGNRHDYWVAPAYNLNLLLSDNFCPSASLFDRRVFDTGVRYPEDMIWGHEDWDLVLQLAEREIYGEAAAFPTFRYRKRGFSRVNVVDLGTSEFHKDLSARHPLLFQTRRDRIKAEWAPALSVILLDASQVPWPAGLGNQLETQTCRDFELLLPERVDVETQELVLRHFPTQASPAESLGEQIQAARGRFVLIVSPVSAKAFCHKTFIEQVIRLLWQNQDLERVVFASRGDVRAPSFTPQSAESAALTKPSAVAWKRSPIRANGLDDTRGNDIIELGLTESVLDDIVLSWQANAPLSWRII